MGYRLDFGPVLDAIPDLLWGCGGTLLLAFSGMALALAIGIGGVVLRDSPVRPFRWLVIAFVELIRNTPFLVQIYFIFFALPLLGIRLDADADRHHRARRQRRRLRDRDHPRRRAVDQQGAGRGRAGAWACTRRRCSGSSC